MRMEEPKVEYVELKLDDVIATSSGSSVAFCQKAGDDNEDCTTAPVGTSYNYSDPECELHGNYEDCGGVLSQFDY